MPLVLRATIKEEKRGENSHKTPKSCPPRALSHFRFCRDAKNRFCLALVMLDRVKVSGNRESIEVGQSDDFLWLSRLLLES